MFCIFKLTLIKYFNEEKLLDEFLKQICVQSYFTFEFCEAFLCE